MGSVLKKDPFRKLGPYDQNEGGIFFGPLNGSLDERVGVELYFEVENQVKKEEEKRLSLIYLYLPRRHTRRLTFYFVIRLKIIAAIVLFFCTFSPLMVCKHDIT